MNKFNVKKVFTLAMASSMLLTPMTNVFAVEADTDTTITIEEAKGNEYKAFQLMTLITDGEHYSYDINPTYRSIIVETINEMDSNANISTDDTIIKYLETLTDARTFADKVYTKIRSNNISAELTTTTGIFNEASQGYYLIAETGTIAEGTDRTLVMLDTLGKESITVKEKRGVPTLDKVIVENDTDVEHTDAGLNDEVTYKLTGTMPENIDSYGKYKYIMHDNLPAGLTYKNVVSISINGVELESPELFEVKTTDHCTVEFRFDDIKSIASNADIEINASTEVIVKYVATVNEDAVVGNPGNQNKAYLEFSNDPYDEGSTEKTPEDDAKVFTFSVLVNKVDKDKKPLTGAEFKLQMKVDGEYVDLGNDVEYRKDETGTVFTFEGLDVGEYKLVETTVPTGYNKADDVEFKIAVDYENEAIKTLTIYDKNDNVIGQTDLESEDAIFSINSDTNGTASTDVINTTGIKLPSTGSTGAIMVYCVSGVALMVGITSFVVAKKKKNNN